MNMNEISAGNEPIAATIAAEHIIALGSRMPYDNNKAAGFEITDLGDPVILLILCLKMAVIRF